MTMHFLRVVAGLLPFVSCLLVWLAATGWVGSWRRGLLVAATACGAVLVLGTELLSLAGLLRPAPVALLWSVVAVLAVVSVLRRPPSWRGLREGGAVVGLVPAGYLAVLVSVLGLLAVVSPTNTWDSMTYRMPRVVAWAAAGSVAPYATEISRQLFNPPLTEYAVLHSLLLSGTDRWANLVQLVALAVSAVALTVAAANLGLGRRAQVWTAVIACTVPMAVAQAPTTHNDLVLTMWACCLVALVTEPASRLVTWPHMVLVATTFALAVATKGTAFFFVPPIALWYVVKMLRHRPLAAIQAVMTCLVVVVALNLAVWTRNLAVFDTPLAPSEGHVRPALSWATVVGTAVRDVGLQLGVPVSAELNSRVASLLSHILEVLGIDPNDPGAVPPGYRFDVEFGNREDTAGSPLHLLLLLTAPVVLAVRRRLRQFVPYLAVLLGGFVLLALLSRWSPFGNRYLVVLFVLGAPVVAAALEALPRWTARACLVVLSVSATYWVVLSDLRPLVGDRSVLTTARGDQYFAARTELAEPYRRVVERIDPDQERVGVVQGIDSWEYPLWVLLGGLDGSPRLVAVDVTNPSRSYEETTPDTVVCTVPCDPPGDWERETFGGVTLLTRR
jgi:hypothetical protein